MTYQPLNKEVISRLINLAIASSKIKKITIEEEARDFDGRTNLNIFLYGSIGATKSVLLNEISEKIKCPSPFTDLTYPALIGTIDNRTTQLLIGACWECKNSLLLLDEYNLGKRNKDDIRALLQLIEGGKYKKKMASFSAPAEEKDEDLFYSYKEGTFHIKTRFSLILATMKYPYYSQSPEVQALVSRCIAIPYYPTKEDLINIAKGYPIFSYKDLTPKKLNITVNKKDYTKILNFVVKQTEEFNFLRVLNDCVRIFAILGKHDEKLYKIIIKLGSEKFKTLTKKKK